MSGELIRVTIEMIPSGLGRPRTMAVIDIANNVAKWAESGGSKGDYDATLSRISRVPGSVGHESLWKTAHVTDFPRNARTVYDLLYRVLDQVVGRRNP